MFKRDTTPLNLEEVRTKLIDLAAQIQTRYQQQVQANPSKKKEMFTSMLDMLDLGAFLLPASKILTKDVLNFIYANPDAVNTLLGTQVLDEIPPEYLDLYILLFDIVVKNRLDKLDFRQAILTAGSTLHLFRAAEWMKEKNWEQAKLEAFDGLKITRNIELPNANRMLARYYLGYCLLGEGKKEGAKQQFEFALGEYQKVSHYPVAKSETVQKIFQDIQEALKKLA